MLLLETFRTEPGSPVRWNTSMRIRSLHQGLALTALLATVGAAQTLSPLRREGGYYVQEERGELPAAPRLRISSTGAVEVEGGVGRQVSYQLTRKVKASSEGEAQRLFDEAPLTAARQGGSVTLRVDKPSCWSCGFSAALHVSAPHATQEALISTTGGAIRVSNIEGRVNADTAAGAISADNIGGGVRATTSGGPITLGAIGGPVRCETAGGPIKVGAVRGETVLSTSGGRIEVGEVLGSLRAETSGGDIKAQRVAGEVFAGTSGGVIQIGEALGRVVAETAGGSIEIAKAPQGVTADTAGGRIRLTEVAGAIRAASAAGNIEAVFLNGSPVADSLIETNAGAIVVFLPASLRVAVDASVGFARGLNRIESEFADIQVVRGSGGASEVRAVGVLNGGGPVLRIRNTSGRIQIRRLPE